MLPNFSKQLGFSIIELMIATTLGMVLTGAAIQFMLGSNQTYALNDDLSRVQENGRVAMDILAMDLRRAGYQEDLRGVKPFVVMSDCTHSSGATMPCASEGSGNDSDTLPIQYAASSSINTDCLGRAPTLVAGGSANDVIANVYTIQDSDFSNQVSSLYCEGYNVTTGAVIPGGAQPIVDGIDRMQVLYRVENTTTSTAEYMSFDRVKAAGREEDITAIRIGLLVSNGLTTGKANPTTKKYQLLDSNNSLDITNDTQMRRIYTSTIQLNNRHAGATP